MISLKDVKRPNLAMIKIIEAIGILLQVPKSNVKSKYKAAVPSNYDATIEIISDDYNSVLNSLFALKATGIPNAIAKELFSKTREPGFDYENAVLAGGLQCRDLFNTLFLLIQRLQEDIFRIPIKACNSVMVSTGNRASYVALDVTSHLHDQGLCTVLVFKPSETQYLDQVIDGDHLCSDLLRRGKHQYKKNDQNFSVINITTFDGLDMSLKNITQNYIAETNSNLLVLGADLFKSSDSMKELLDWACWDWNGVLICAKSSSRVLPFHALAMPRKYIFCIKNEQELEPFFLQCIQLMQPNDIACLLHVTDLSDPIGDWRDTRFNFGASYSWINGETPAICSNGSIGWNDDSLERLQIKMQELIIAAKIYGTCKLINYSEYLTVGQQICNAAIEECADFIVISRGSDREVSKECIDAAACSVILL
jgi:hypothetical protein